MTIDGGLAVPEDEPTPLAGAEALLDTLLGVEGPALHLEAPRFVALDRGEQPWLTVGAAGRGDALAQLRLERRAFVVAVDVERGHARVVHAAATDGATPRVPPAPGFEGGLGPAPTTRGAQVARFAMWDRGSPWPPGTYALVAVAAERTSPRIETVIGRASTTVDPVAEPVAPELLRVWPPPDPAGNLPHYQPLPQSPKAPSEPGVVLVVPRVAPTGTAVVHASFRARLRPRWVMPFGAVVPITLVLTGSEDPTPIVLALRVPSFGSIDPARPPPTVTGTFALDLMKLAPLAASPQAWFLHAFSTDVSAPPAVITVPASW
jgi:hypothetical protein